MPSLQSGHTIVPEKATEPVTIKENKLIFKDRNHCLINNLSVNPRSIPSKSTVRKKITPKEEEKKEEISKLDTKEIKAPETDANKDSAKSGDRKPGAKKGANSAPNAKKEDNVELEDNDKPEGIVKPKKKNDPRNYLSENPIIRPIYLNHECQYDIMPDCITSNEIAALQRYARLEEDKHGCWWLCLGFQPILRVRNEGNNVVNNEASIDIDSGWRRRLKDLPHYHENIDYVEEMRNTLHEQHEYMKSIGWKVIDKIVGNEEMKAFKYKSERD